MLPQTCSVLVAITRPRLAGSQSKKPTSWRSQRVPSTEATALLQAMLDQGTRVFNSSGNLGYVRSRRGDRKPRDQPDIGGACVFFGRCSIRMSARSHQIWTAGDRAVVSGPWRVRSHDGDSVLQKRHAIHRSS